MTKYALAVQQPLHTADLEGAVHDALGQADFQAPAVDADDLVAGTADQHALAVELLLGQPGRIGQQLFGFGFVDGIEQLWQNAGRPLLLVGLLIRRARLAGRVALGGLLLDQLVVNPFGGGKIDRAGRLRAGLQRGAAATKGEVDDEAGTARLDGCVVNLVGRSRFVIKRDGLRRCSG